MAAVQVTERYPLSGETREFRRRDLRRGAAACSADRPPARGGQLPDGLRRVLLLGCGGMVQPA